MGLAEEGRVGRGLAIVAAPPKRLAVRGAQNEIAAGCMASLGTGAVAMGPLFSVLGRRYRRRRRKRSERRGESFKFTPQCKVCTSNATQECLLGCTAREFTLPGPGTPCFL